MMGSDNLTAVTRYSRAITPDNQLPISTTYKPLADGVSGTRQSLRAMAQAVRHGLPPEYVGFKDAYNINAANQIACDPSKGFISLYQYARDQIQYIDHPWHMQVVQDAKRTLQLGTGDCVSKSVLLATLLASLGVKSRFVTQATTGEGFDHVYVEVKTGQEQYAARMGQQRQYQPWRDTWLALDPTADGRDGRPLGYPGWTQRLYDGGFEMTHEIF